MELSRVMRMFWKQYSTRCVICTVIVFLCCFAYTFYDRETVSFKTRRRHIDRKMLSDKSAQFQLLDPGQDEDFLIPGDDVLRQLDEDDLMRIYWRYINTLQVLCRNPFRFGAFGDGGKEVCLDKIFKPTPPCIVYSFGSNFQFDFDLTAHNFLGCDVHTFDPSMHTQGPRKQHPIPPELHFHQIGLSGRDYVSDMFWDMKTLQTIMRENRHQNRIIDILKIDIEGAEWESLPNILESGVYKQIKQLLIEVHVGHVFADANRPFWGHVDVAKQLRVLRMLYEHGFRIFMRDRTVVSQLKLQAPPQEYITTQNEISLLNVAFLQSDSGI